MNQEIRNKLRNVVTQCRKLLEDSVSQELEGKYGIFAKKDQVTADPNAKTTHLTEEEQAILNIIKDQQGEHKIGDLYRIYKEHNGQLVYKSFQRKIDKLEKNKFIAVKKTQGGKDGNTTFVSYGSARKLTDF